MSAIEDVLWPGFKDIEPSVRLGGIYANKPGYHNKRENLPSSDYSVGQFAVDRVGPADEASAIDLTFPDAQGGNYSTISKYSKRLYAARNEGDERTKFMREFFGQIDSDRSVEGWDYSKNRASSSDSSHLWHIHISIHRKYINSVTAMRAILSILKGETLEQWRGSTRRDVVFEEFTAELPVLAQGDSDPIRSSGSASYVARAQKVLGGLTADGDYGPLTVARVRAVVPEAVKHGIEIGIPEYAKIYGMFGATTESVRVEEGRNRTIQNATFKATLPILIQGDSDENGGITGGGASYVARAQRALGVDDDGDYGPVTANAVRALGINDGKSIDLEVYSQLYGLWGYTRTNTRVSAGKKKK